MTITWTWVVIAVCWIWLVLYMLWSRRVERARQLILLGLYEGSVYVDVLMYRSHGRRAFSEALKRLREEGLVVAEEESSDGAPRLVYSLTREGRNAASWIKYASEVGA